MGFKCLQPCFFKEFPYFVGRTTVFFSLKSHIFSIGWGKFPKPSVFRSCFVFTVLSIMKVLFVEPVIGKMGGRLNRYVEVTQVW